MKALEKLPALLAAQDWPAAERVLKRAAQARPGEAAILYNLGRVLMEQGQWAPARHWLKQAIAAQPKHQAAWFELGRTSLELSEVGAARVAFSKALELDPSDQDAARNLGRVALRLGDFAAARAAYAKLDPNEIETACALYRIAAETGDPEASALRAGLLARRSDRAQVLKALTRTAKGALPLNL